MFIFKFFKGNPNLVVLRAFKAILRDQVYFENNMAMD